MFFMKMARYVVQSAMNKDMGEYNLWWWWILDLVIVSSFQIVITISIATYFWTFSFISEYLKTQNGIITNSTEWNQISYENIFLKL